jgi:hypothetical protein
MTPDCVRVTGPEDSGAAGAGVGAGDAGADVGAGARGRREYTSSGGAWGVGLGLAEGAGPDPPERTGPDGGTGPRPPGPACSKEGGGCSMSEENRVTTGAKGRAAWLVGQSIVSTVSSGKKSRDDEGGGGEASANGKCDSLKTTWREMMMRLVDKSRQRYPL